MLSTNTHRLVISFCFLFAKLNAESVENRVTQLEKTTNLLRNKTEEKMTVLDNKIDEKTTLLDKKIEELTKRIAYLPSENTTAEKTTVAFMACIKEQYARGLSEGTTLVFNDAVTNVGSAYNPANGIFTVPRSGLYLFNLIGMNGVGKHQYLYMNLRTKNGNTMPGGYMHVDARNVMFFPTSSKMWVLRVEEGTQVSIVAGGFGSSQELYGYCYTSFFGTLLSAG